MNEQHLFHQDYVKNICFAHAKECKTAKEFRIKHMKSYKIAKRNNWIKDMSWLYSPIKK